MYDGKVLSFCIFALAYSKACHANRESLYERAITGISCWVFSVYNQYLHHMHVRRQFPKMKPDHQKIHAMPVTRWPQKNPSPNDGLSKVILLPFGK